MKNKIKKISLDGNDDLEKAIAKIKKARGDEAVLTISNDSAIGMSLDAIQSLKTGAARVGKKIIIESVNDHTVELAALAGIESKNPIFQTKTRPVYDILPRKRENTSSIKPINPLSRPKKSDEFGNENLEENLEGELPEKKNKILWFFARTRENRPKNFEVETPLVKDWILAREKKEKTVKPPKIKYMDSKPAGSRWLKTTAYFSILAILLGTGFWVSMIVLPKATIRLVMKTYPVSFTRAVMASATTSRTDVQEGNVKIPGELFVSKKNTEMSFPASGKEKVEKYADGKISVFNGFSSSPQTLVAKTRFQTPDGKIFRIKDTVIVPGANIEKGKISPSSIIADVVADSPGANFNIPPVPKWTIPGFKDSPRFEGFYGKSTAPMKGGFSGETAKPTETDLAEARKKVKEALLQATKTEMAIMISPAYELLEGTTSFEIKKEDAYGSPDNFAKFTLFMEGELKQFVFKKNDLTDAIVEGTKEELDKTVKFDLKNLVIKYESITPDIEKGSLSLNALGKATFIASVDAGSLARELMGKNTGGVKQAVFRLPGLEKAHVSLWPFWVQKVPGNINKITIAVE